MVDSIGDAVTESVLFCFLRNVLVCGWATETELEKLFKPNMYQYSMSQTPNLARTGSFGPLTGKLSIREEDLLNKGNTSKHSFEVESEEY